MKEFGVSVFGSARIECDAPAYLQAFDLGASLAQENIDLVTGGGPGIMEAAAKGHSSIESPSKAWGLTIELPFEDDGNEYNQVVERFARFSRRLERFMSLSRAVVVMDGGVGTGLELFFTWQLMQVQHVGSMPIILMGKQWMHFKKWASHYMLAPGYVGRSDVDMLYVVKNNEQAMQIIEYARKCYIEGTPYKQDFFSHE